MVSSEEIIFTIFTMKSSAAKTLTIPRPTGKDDYNGVGFIKTGL